MRNEGSRIQGILEVGVGEEGALVQMQKADILMLKVATKNRCIYISGKAYDINKINSRNLGVLNMEKDMQVCFLSWVVQFFMWTDMVNSVSTIHLYKMKQSKAYKI